MFHTLTQPRPEKAAARNVHFACGRTCNWNASVNFLPAVHAALRGLFAPFLLSNIKRSATVQRASLKTVGREPAPTGVSQARPTEHVIVVFTFVSREHPHN